MKTKRTLIIELEIETDVDNIDWDAVLKNSIHDTSWCNYNSKGIIRTKQLSRKWHKVPVLKLI